jgi:hypothetical protein
MQAANTLSHPSISRFDSALFAIDDKMAQSILDRLGYTLQDLSLEYGDVVIPNEDICGQVFYSSPYNSAELVGYIWIDNGLYYTSCGVLNHKTMELAALELLPRHLVIDTAYAIELERVIAPDYF